MFYVYVECICRDVWISDDAPVSCASYSRLALYFFIVPHLISSWIWLKREIGDLKEDRERERDQGQYDSICFIKHLKGAWHRMRRAHRDNGVGWKKWADTIWRWGARQYSIRAVNSTEKLLFWGLAIRCHMSWAQTYCGGSCFQMNTKLSDLFLSCLVAPSTWHFPYITDGLHHRHARCAPPQNMSTSSPTVGVWHHLKVQYQMLHRCTILH